MNAATFAEGYDRQIKPFHLSDQHEAVMEKSREWSLFLGETVHRLFSEDERLATHFTNDHWAAYRAWLRNDLTSTVANIADLPDSEAAPSMNEVNFHQLNYSMVEMWHPLWSSRPWHKQRTRTEAINFSQNSLGMTGLRHYLARDATINMLGGTETLYETDNPMYRSFVGRLQEYDVAIVLLDVMRRNADITIVPAPLQFEASHVKGRNVDFLAVDTKACTAVGVQVKSRLHKDHLEDQDPDRVVFIDGDTDLGNIKAVRTKQGRSTERIVPWPGIISTKSVLRMKMHGAGKNAALAREPHTAAYYKMRAHSLVGDIKVDFSDLSGKVGARIMAKLAEQ